MGEKSRLQSSGRHLLSLINGLLDLARIESGKVELKLEPVSCGALLEEVCATLRPLAEAKNLSFALQLPKEDVVLRTDRRSLSQIVINLSANAIKFTETGGVVLKLRQRRRKGRVATTIWVADTGIGIAPGPQAKLFQAFAQLELKLDEAARRHRIGPASFTEARAVDRRRDQRQKRAWQGERVHSNHLGQTMMGRVLMVEDNPENLELMRYLLHAFGHVTLSAGNGEDGVEIALRERPDVIVCDIDMPKLDGYGVARALNICPTFRRAPLIAVTALAMVGDREKVLAAGFDGYIGKPIEPTTFVRDIEAFLGSRRLHSSPLA